MGNRTAPDLREAIEIDVVIYEGRPAIRSTSTRRKYSSKVATEDHVEHLKFINLEAGIQIGEQLAATCREFIAGEPKQEEVSED